MVLFHCNLRANALVSREIWRSLNTPKLRPSFPSPLAGRVALRSNDGWGRNYHQMPFLRSRIPPNGFAATLPWSGGKRSRLSSAMSVNRARNFRKNLTDEETILWSELRLLRQKKLHFRRQVPRDGYILDFACLKAKVIVEVDGVQHAMGRQKQSDKVRDAHFESLGFIILRYWNSEVRNELDAVVTDILFRTSKRLSPPVPAAPGHPPRSGEGKRPSKP